MALPNDIKQQVLLQRNRLKKRLRGRITPPQYPLALEKRYRAFLLNELKVIERSFKRDLLKIIQEGKKEVSNDRRDAFSDDIERLINSIKLRLGNFTAEAEQVTFNLAQLINQKNEREVKAMVQKAIGIDIIAAEPWLTPTLTNYAKTNVSLIKKTFNFLADDLETMAYLAVTQGIRAEDLAKDIQKKFDVTESRARLIARDQTAKLTGQLNKNRQQNLGINKYEWLTSRDDRVRDSHAEKDGNIYEWDKPPSDTGHPTEDFQCRCTAVPVFDDYFALVD